MKITARSMTSTARSRPRLLAALVDDGPPSLAHDAPEPWEPRVGAGRRRERAGPRRGPAGAPRWPPRPPSDLRERGIRLNPSGPPPCDGRRRTSASIRSWWPQLRLGAAHAFQPPVAAVHQLQEAVSTTPRRHAVATAPKLLAALRRPQPRLSLAPLATASQPPVAVLNQL